MSILGFLSGLANSIEVPTCPDCGSTMKRTDLSDGEMLWTCPNGCHEVTQEDIEMGILELYDHNEVYSMDDIPEGCRACGGDYPNCKDSCPMFDD